jgi:hypothetical protein
LLKNKTASSTHKRVAVALFEGPADQGYVNPASLGHDQAIELLTRDGEHKAITIDHVKAAYFVKEFTESPEPERKTLLSRPKLDGLWVRLRFRDDDEIEGVVPNDLLDLLDGGIRLTPPDLHGNCLRIFIPRTALTEMKVLGVVGVARRPQRAKVATADRPSDAQAKLFSE